MFTDGDEICLELHPFFKKHYKTFGLDIKILNDIYKSKNETMYNSVLMNQLKKTIKVGQGVYMDEFSEEIYTIFVREDRKDYRKDSIEAILDEWYEEYSKYNIHKSFMNIAMSDN